VTALCLKGIDVDVPLAVPKLWQCRRTQDVQRVGNVGSEP